MSGESAMSAWIEVVSKDNTLLWNLSPTNIQHFLYLYSQFLPIGIEALDKIRFKGLTASAVDGNKSEQEDSNREQRQLERYQIIIELSHWLYKRCLGKQRDVCRAHHQLLESTKSSEIEKAADEAFTLFDNNEHACAVSKLQVLLKQDEEMVPTKFDLAILILSAKYPDQVPFCSPELRNCINVGRDALSHEVNNRNKWGNDTYAEDYALFEHHCDQVMDNMKTTEDKRPTAQEIEKLAYVLDRWNTLRATHIDPEVIDIDEREEVGTARGNDTKISKGSKKSYHKLLPDTFAVKSISTYKRNIGRYLNEIQIHASQELETVISADFCYQHPMF
ncbi:uncharacterized protein E0L32_004153 [Thyridium curvatum]|uniref:Uncharacterized protein n=1 Tax=Thyridium curvatum TaxID=1093900 RepID=A0A507BHE5_9PEZI|nr:uncharacterized protein E0L32_004153 [Thyridium curvatum]TPX16158.1 hypothetical protein E0L32_004153 [Thyridium curvatum]